MKWPKYPRCVESQKRTRNRDAKCLLCGALATRHAWVQVSYMRGDDERFWVCETCYRHDQGDHDRQHMCQRLLAARPTAESSGSPKP